MLRATERWRSLLFFRCTGTWSSRQRHTCRQGVNKETAKHECNKCKVAIAVDHVGLMRLGPGAVYVRFTCGLGTVRL
eukprot:7578407-Alexandrium_andersonii.AAC.1